MAPSTYCVTVPFMSVINNGIRLIHKMHKMHTGLYCLWHFFSNGIFTANYRRPSGFLAIFQDIKLTCFFPGQRRTLQINGIRWWEHSRNTYLAQGTFSHQIAIIHIKMQVYQWPFNKHFYLENNQLMEQKNLYNFPELKEKSVFLIFFRIS